MVLTVQQGYIEFLKYVFSFGCIRSQLQHVGHFTVLLGLFSSCGSWALEYRLGSCGTPGQLPHNMWRLPGAGIKPVSPALAGGFITTGPPGKS